MQRLHVALPKRCSGFTATDICLDVIGQACSASPRYPLLADPEYRGALGEPAATWWAERMRLGAREIGALLRYLTNGTFEVMIDWKQCTAVERLYGKVSGAWVFKGTRVPDRTLTHWILAG